MVTRLGSIGEVYERQHHLGGAPVDIVANSLENVDNAVRGVFGNSEVRVEQRTNIVSATTAALGDLAHSVTRGKIVTALGDLWGVVNAPFKDFKDAVLAKPGESVIVRNAK